MERARIGPNTIIQTIEALKEVYGYSRTVALLQQGGMPTLIDNLPTHMVEEQEFHTLVTMLVQQIGSEQTGHILKRSGVRTAMYLLKNRIPPFFQTLVKRLPTGAGFTLLLLAIGKNAWTFVGSGRFRFLGGPSPRLIISNPNPNPNDNEHRSVPPELCSFYAGTFEHLFQVLLRPDTQVQEIDCRASDETRCAYAIVYHGLSRGA